MTEFIRNINWELLRKQKATLVEVLILGDLSRREKNDLDGIVHLLDSLQDYVVDEMLVDEELVFGFSGRKFICMACGQATTSTVAYCEGGHLMVGIESHHKETMPERWGKAKDIFGMDDQTLETYIENQVSIVILNRKK